MSLPKWFPGDEPDSLPWSETDQPRRGWFRHQWIGHHQTLVNGQWKDFDNIYLDGETLTFAQVGKAATVTPSDDPDNPDREWRWRASVDDPWRRMNRYELTQMWDEVHRINYRLHQAEHLN